MFLEQLGELPRQRRELANLLKATGDFNDAEAKSAVGDLGEALKNMNLEFTVRAIRLLKNVPEAKGFPSSKVYKDLAEQELALRVPVESEPEEKEAKKRGRTKKAVLDKPTIERITLFRYVKQVFRLGKQRGSREEKLRRAFEEEVG